MNDDFSIGMRTGLLTICQGRAYIRVVDRETAMTKEWKKARTQAHLWIDGSYSGITVSLTKCRPTDAVLVALGLPPLPR